ncbi:spermidine synthase [Rhizomicrobium electricum]|jgi:spermidine synthase|uniref:Class I SAM-dependent methyltransferase n=1 Tax=Rhizomicrobium electricum TaxID=480070 RepID=A0ABN1EG88_9PROT|nr:fused MFS/spermidine synthase [Rhizomicrobium electricum]NIJ48536.1 spermidine synthase [Rhizomicrobium electricum]
MPRKKTSATADHGLVVEYNNASGKVSFWQKDDNHSLADSRGISTADYIHAMYGFLRQAGSRHVLMIGCGGGTLATMLRRVGVRVTMVDIDGRSFEIASTYFHLPADVECHIADGEAFLKKTGDKYDAVVLDAYCDNEIPRHMRSRRFFNLVKSRLKLRGVVLLNLIVRDDDDGTPDRIARMMQRTWRQVRLLDAVGHEGRNAVAVAGAVKNLKRPRLLMRPKCCAKSLARDLRTLDFRPVRA